MRLLTNFLCNYEYIDFAAFAPPSEAHARIAYALTEVRKYLIPDSNDEIRQEQMREMVLMSASSAMPPQAKASPNGLDVDSTGYHYFVHHCTQKKRMMGGYCLMGASLPLDRTTRVLCTL